MSYKIGIAADMGDLLVQLDAFLAVGHTLEPMYDTLSDGEIENMIGATGSVLETITVKFTGANSFTVVGSESGSIGTGTVGTPFVSTKVCFEITPGSTPFSIDDTIEFVMTPPWKRLRAINIGSVTDEYIWCAPGNDGESEIFVGMLRFENANADYDNVRLGGFTGYSPAETFLNQPGPCTRPVMPGLRIGDIPYWFIANGRRVMVFIKCTSVYAGAYLGFINQYWRPEQWPYPLAVGGSMSWANEPAVNSTNWRYSYQGNEHNLIVFANMQAVSPTNENSFTLRLRRPDGRWRGFGIYNATYASLLTSAYVWPYNGGRFSNVRPNLDGEYSLFPVNLSEDDSGTTHPAQFGEMDGIFAVTGYENAAENIITVGRTKYLVMQNAYRTTYADFCAIKLS